MKNLINKINFGRWQDYSEKIPDNSIDLIITDPPYNCTASKWDEEVDLAEMFSTFNRVIKKDGAMCVFGSQPFTTDLILANRKHYRYCWYWRKNRGSNFLHAKHAPLRMVEEIVLFSKEKPVYYPQITDGHTPTNSAKGRNTGNVYHGKMSLSYEGGKTTRYPKNVLDIKCVSNYSRIHSAEKPIELIHYLIKTYAKKGDVVADFYSGSGVTACACIEAGLDYVCFEKEIEEYNKSINRIERVKEQGRLFAI